VLICVKNFQCNQRNIVIPDNDPGQRSNFFMFFKAFMVEICVNLKFLPLWQKTKNCKNIFIVSQCQLTPGVVGWCNRRFRPFFDA
jgi:hypothetical protein